MSRSLDSREEAEVGQGDVAIWDELWRTADSANLTHYTKGRPETVPQLANRGYFEGIWSALSFDASKTCVELGAGRGNQALYLTAVGVRVIMVDLSDSGFDLARRHFAREGLPVPPMVVADVRDTKLPEAEADLVYSIGLLEHFEDPAPILIESHRILKPGGLVHHIVVPAARARNLWLAKLTLNPVRFVLDPVKSVIKWIIRYPKYESKGTITDYGVKEYAAWMEEIGFQDVSVVPINPYHPVHVSTRCARRIAMPIYRAHYAFKRWLGTDPNLATWPSVANSLLVRGKKPGGS